MTENIFDKTLINDEEWEKVKISRVNTRPNAKSSYGTGSFDASQTKELFDAQGNVLRERHNSLVTVVKNAEELRSIAEAERLEAEETRVSSETSRASNEKERIDAELGRVDAETQRVANETARLEVTDTLKEALANLITLQEQYIAKGATV